MARAYLHAGSNTRRDALEEVERHAEPGYDGRTLSPRIDGIPPKTGCQSSVGRRCAPLRHLLFFNTEPREHLRLLKSFLIRISLPLPFATYSKGTECR